MRSIDPNYRLATAWMLCAVVVSILQAAPIVQAWTLQPPYDTRVAYYAVVPMHRVMTLPAAFVMFAVAYALIEGAFKLTIKRRLGWAHLVATFVGANLIFLPMLTLRAIGPDGVLPPAEYLNWIASAGYLLVLTGLALFLALLIDALWRHFRPSQPLASAR